MYPPPDRIDSRSNQLLKSVRRLRDAHERAAGGTFFVEGIAGVLAAIQNDAQIDGLVVAPELLRSSHAKSVVDSAAQAGTLVHWLGVDAFASISTRDNPTGLGAIVKIPRAGFESIVLTDRSVLVALVEPANPGNLGTVVRTAAGAGGAGVVVIGGGVDPWHPAAVKAAMGSLWALPIVQVDLWATFKKWASDEGVSLITTSAHASDDLWNAEYSFPAAVVLGTESTGLPGDIVAAGAPSVRIPMAGGASSLNVAVAAGIVLYEVARRAQT